jgi:hypothetical protein
MSAVSGRGADGGQRRQAEGAGREARLNPEREAAKSFEAKNTLEFDDDKQNRFHSFFEICVKKKYQSVIIVARQNRISPRLDAVTFFAFVADAVA